MCSNAFKADQWGGNSPLCLRLIAPLKEASPAAACQEGYDRNADLRSAWHWHTHAHRYTQNDTHTRVCVVCVCTPMSYLAEHTSTACRPSSCIIAIRLSRQFGLPRWFWLQGSQHRRKWASLGPRPSQHRQRQETSWIARLLLQLPTYVASMTS